MSSGLDAPEERVNVTESLLLSLCDQSEMEADPYLKKANFLPTI